MQLICIFRDFLPHFFGLAAFLTLTNLMRFVVSTLEPLIFFVKEKIQWLNQKAWGGLKYGLFGACLITFATVILPATLLWFSNWYKIAVYWGDLGDNPAYFMLSATAIGSFVLSLLLSVTVRRTYLSFRNASGSIVAVAEISIIYFAAALSYPFVARNAGLPDASDFFVSQQTYFLGLLMFYAAVVGIAQLGMATLGLILLPLWAVSQLAVFADKHPKGIVVAITSSLGILFWLLNQYGSCELGSLDESERSALYEIPSFAATAAVKKIPIVDSVSLPVFTQ